MTATPYDAFRAAHRPGTASGAPWTVIYGSTPTKNCTYITTDWCDDGLCLECEIYPTTNQTFVNDNPRTWIANVSLEMQSARLSGITFWKYTAVYYGQGAPPGTSSPITSSIGHTTFDDTVMAMNYGSEDIPQNPWVYSSLISHNGSTALELSPDGKYGYIPISISLDMKANQRTDLLFFDLRAIDFQILSYIDSPSETGGSGGAPDGRIVGTVIAGVVVLIVTFLVILWYRRKRSTEAVVLSEKGVIDHGTQRVPPPAGTRPRIQDNEAFSSRSREASDPFANVSPARNTFTLSSGTRDHIDQHPASDTDFPSPRGSLTHADPAVPPYPISLRASPYNRPIPEEDVCAAPDPASLIPNQVALERAACLSTPTDRPSSLHGSSPPVYGSSSAFSTWAHSNRDSVSENLAAKLLAAGYMPRDDPDILEETEWRAQHGVTKLELMRMRRIYARDQNTYT